MSDDPRLTDARSLDIFRVADDLAITGLSAPRRGEKIGPCPVCGGKDRFSIDQKKALFNCRHCGGGDVIRLVEFVRGVDFKAALDWLCGSSRDIPEAERKARAERDARTRAEAEAAQAKYRAEATARARRIWRQGLDAGDPMIRAYFARRGLPDWLLEPPPACLRFHPDLPYMIQPNGRRDYVQIHRGPAMLAAVQKPNRRAEAVHRTWIDPARPNGKALIADPETGEVLPAKKVEGSKRGGAIRLTGNFRSDILIMGEGIETTLSARVAWDGPEAMFWAGVDLGNMSGRMLRVPGQRHSGLPDMADDEAFLPPPWVRRLIFVMDGDSDPKMTEARLRAGLRRAMARWPGLKGQIARAPHGMDLNDVLMGEENG
jgi:hypothetical protein